MVSYFGLALLVVTAVADPLRHKRQTEELIAVAGAATAEHSTGWAADNHAEAVIATGIPGSGWGPDSLGVPASIHTSSQGLSEVENFAGIQQITANDGQGNLLGTQNIQVDQFVVGDNTLLVNASGQDVALASASDAIAQGAGNSAAVGVLDILVQPVAGAGWGMTKP